MFGFDVPVDRMSQVEEMVRDLNDINMQISEAVNFKEKLERSIIAALGRAEFVQDDETGKVILANIKKEGTETHPVGRFKVTVKTDFNYRINKSEYEALRKHIRPEFDPIKVKTEYSIDKDKFRLVNEYGSLSDVQLRDKIVTLVPSKPSITIKANV